MKEPQLPISTPITTIPTPHQPPSSPSSPPRFLIIGAGSRGSAYARAVTTATLGIVHAVAEPYSFKRRELGRAFIWGDTGHPAPGQEFEDWRDWLQWETQRRQKKKEKQDDGDSPEPETPPGVDGVFLCTLDETHAEILYALAPLNLHILCEKPLALSLGDCLGVFRALGGDHSTTTTTTTTKQPTEEKKASPGPSTIFSIGHVLRYSPHNTLLRKLLLSDRVIGDIVSLEHCEPVGWWHFSHSYVRGNWRRETANGDGSLLTKSCHDVDFVLWLLCSPPLSLTFEGDVSSEQVMQMQRVKPHLPRSITSTGHLTQFHKSRKPVLAGAATNCLSCAAEEPCNYSAVKIYRDMHAARGDYEWPVNIVCPDIEDAFSGVSVEEGKKVAEEKLLGRLREDYTTDMRDEEIAGRPWYGRCVYEGDNDVCDDQVVTISWDDEEDETGTKEGAGARRTAKTAVLHMIAPTEKQCERRGRVYGTQGEISYDSRTISIYSFATRSTTTIEVPRQPVEEEKAHGGGDYGLARSFVRAVDAVLNGGWEVESAQRHFVGCTLEEAVRSHAVVFAAEEARREEKVVKWKDWWAEKLAAAAAAASG